MLGHLVFFRIYNRTYIGISMSCDCTLMFSKPMRHIRRTFYNSFIRNKFPTFNKLSKKVNMFHFTLAFLESLYS